MADRLIRTFGPGHTSVLYTNPLNKENIDKFGSVIKTVRVLINTPAAQVCVARYHRGWVECALMSLHCAFRPSSAFIPGYHHSLAHLCSAGCNWRPVQLPPGPLADSRVRLLGKHLGVLQRRPLQHAQHQERHGAPREHALVQDPPQGLFQGAEGRSRGGILAPHGGYIVGLLCTCSLSPYSPNPPPPSDPQPQGGCLEVALKELKGKQRALIVTDKPLFDMGYTTKVTSVLDTINVHHQVFYQVGLGQRLRMGREAASLPFPEHSLNPRSILIPLAPTYLQVPPDPTLACIKEGLHECNSFKPDVIIAIGGGSPMDAAKVIWLMYEQPDTEFGGLAMRFMDIRKRSVALPSLVSPPNAMFIAGQAWAEGRHVKGGPLISPSPAPQGVRDQPLRQGPQGDHDLHPHHLGNRLRGHSLLRGHGPRDWAEVPPG